MAARLQRNVGSSAACLITGSAQSVNFCVRLTGFLVPAFSDFDTVFNDNAAHARVRAGGVQTFLCESEGVSHPFQVVG